MLIIICPHCGPRNSNEYSYQGEIVPRPSMEANAAEWRRYLYIKDNAAGSQVERWFHVSGCRRFLDVIRDNETNENRSVVPAGTGES